MAEVVGRVDEVRAAAEERNANGHDVAQVEENDTDTVEGVVSGVRAEPNEAEEDLDDEAADHAVEGHTESVVDLLVPLGGGHGVVTGEGPDTAGGGGGASGAAEDAEEDDGDGENESTGFAADSRAKDDRHGLCVRVVDEGGDVGQNSGQGNEENEANDHVHDGRADHSLGDLGCRALDFLRHRDDHTGGRGSVSSVENTDNERPARNPARVCLEMCEGVFGAVAAFLGDSQDGGDNCNDTCEADVHGGSLYARVRLCRMV